MPIVKIVDDLDRDVLLARAPERIVSLVPSDTHSLVALGGAARVVGRTRYCEDAAVAAAEVVGGTKDVEVDAVLALRPDLVVANQEENTRAQLERLAGRVPLLVSLPRRVPDAVAHLARLARALRVEREPAVRELVRRGYDRLRPGPPAGDGVPVFVPIWADPLMTFNADTYGSDVLAWAGARNVFGDRLRLYPLAADLGKQPPQDAAGRDERYPRVAVEEAARRGAAAVLLPDEPHAFADAEAAALAAALPGAAVRRVSGKDLFWYGAWTIDALDRVAAEVAALAG
jgi:hypothetical protein